MILRFGDCRLNLRTRALTRGGVPTHLQPKMFAFLELLLRERPAVVDKERLLETLWPETFTSESSLPVLVSALREALGDDAREPRYVRTVHRVGYAFAGEVIEEEVDPGPNGDGVHRLWLGDRESWRVPAGESFVGRAPEVGLALDHPSVSRVHAKLLLLGGALLVEDLGSKNGTWTAEGRAKGPFTWRPGDWVRFGEVMAVHRREGDAAEANTRTAAPAPPTGAMRTRSAESARGAATPADDTADASED